MEGEKKKSEKHPVKYAQALSKFCKPIERWKTVRALARLPDDKRSLMDNKTIAEKLSEFTLPCQRCWHIFMPDAANRSEEPAPLKWCAQDVLNQPDKWEANK